jgi:hypothetical protein
MLRQWVMWSVCVREAYEWHDGRPVPSGCEPVKLCRFCVLGSIGNASTRKTPRPSFQVAPPAIGLEHISHVLTGREKAHRWRV